MREGRKVKLREEPMKWVKQRAVTLNKRRAQELAVQEGGGDILQGLYSIGQTEVWRPPAIVDVSNCDLKPVMAEADGSKGYIPQNSFGNIDLYVPTMLPDGAIHLPCEWFQLVVMACIDATQTKVLQRSPRR
jgi:xeroderma pigmentosum group C-complementing protein